MAGIESFIGLIVSLYYWMVIAYVLLSWLPNARESFVGNLLGKLVEPYLAPFRRFIPPIGGMIDISPIVALIALHFIDDGIITLLRLFG